MEIVTYEQKYEKEVVDLWNQSLQADPITIGKFRRQALFDENFDPSLCYTALEGERVVGFCLGIRRKFPYMERGLEPDRGWIVAMFVAEEFRRRGIGTALVNRAERDMKSAGAKNITLSAYSPNYFFPGVDEENYSGAAAFFKKLGYVSGKKDYSMCKDLRRLRKRAIALSTLLMNTHWNFWNLIRTSLGADGNEMLSLPCKMAQQRT